MYKYDRISNLFILIYAIIACIILIYFKGFIAGALGIIIVLLIYISVKLKEIVKLLKQLSSSDNKNLDS